MWYNIAVSVNMGMNLMALTCEIRFSKAYHRAVLCKKGEKNKRKHKYKLRLRILIKRMLAIYYSRYILRVLSTSEQLYM